MSTGRIDYVISSLGPVSNFGFLLLCAKALTLEQLGLIGAYWGFAWISSGFLQAVFVYPRLRNGDFVATCDLFEALSAILLLFGMAAGALVNMEEFLIAGFLGRALFLQAASIRLAKGSLKHSAALALVGVLELVSIALMWMLIKYYQTSLYDITNIFLSTSAIFASLLAPWRTVIPNNLKEVSHVLYHNRTNVAMAIMDTCNSNFANLFVVGLASTGNFKMAGIFRAMQTLAAPVYSISAIVARIAVLRGLPMIRMALWLYGLVLSYIMFVVFWLGHSAGWITFRNEIQMSNLWVCLFVGGGPIFWIALWGSRVLGLLYVAVMSVSIVLLWSSAMILDILELGGGIVYGVFSATPLISGGVYCLWRWSRHDA